MASHADADDGDLYDIAVRLHLDIADPVFGERQGLDGARKF